MNFEGSVTIEAPASDVWTCLLDVNCFSGCLPGVEEVRKIDDSTFSGAMTASVGPMSGKFFFEAHIVESNPPKGLSANVEGIDSVTKSRLNATMAMTLESLSPARTELSYRATVSVQGRLAILGDMVLRATATLLLEEFTKRLRRQLGHGQLA